MNILLFTSLAQPLANLNTRRQVINSESVGEPTYRSIFKGGLISNLRRLTSLGMTAALTRNFCLSLALIPRAIGNESVMIDHMFALGALTLSHPFEVARVLIVCQEENRMCGNMRETLRNVFTSEGVAGLYKGFVPRAIHLLPVYAYFSSSCLMPSSDYSKSFD